MGAMRERTAASRATAGDAYAEEALRALTERRLAALADDGDAPLFFGRVDYRDATDLGSTFHIGKQHIHDETLQPVVIDWRAPVSRPFYRASAAEPLGLSRRRRFGFDGGELTGYETEDLQTGAGGDVAERALREEIERPRVGPMRDIVATIQPEQDDLIRVGLDETICVQGSPGTGKTAVGLHRAAFLLYEHRRALARSGVLFVGPNRAFLSYISRVLPGLGEREVNEATLDELVAAPEAVADDDPEVARLKGDAVMAEVIARAVRGRIAWPEGTVTVRLRGRLLRMEADELADMLRAALAKGVAHDEARRLFDDMLVRRFVELAERRGGVTVGPPEREVAKAVRASEDVRALLKRTWPKMDPVAVVAGLLGHPEWLAACADGLLDADAQERLRWDRAPRSRKRAPWSPADRFLIDEAAGLISRPGSYGHVVADEAQDLSPMMLRALGRRCQHGSVTLLGDLAQATAPWATGSWEATLRHVGKPDGRVVELPRAFRAPRSVLDLASGLLPLIGVDVRAPVSVRDVPDALAHVMVTGDGVAAAAAGAARDALEREGSVGVITPASMLGAVQEALAAGGIEAVAAHEMASGGRLVLLPATAAKGLEFDQVVVVEPTAIADERPAGLRWLYIALTRAVLRLTIVRSRPLPGEATRAPRSGS